MSIRGDDEGGGTVTINKDQLRVAIEKNRATHVEQFKAAMEGYAALCIATLEANLAEIRRGSRKRVLVNEIPPEDHTKDYDRILKMLEMSVKSEIEISQQAFAQYVMDDWGWKESWTLSNSKYVGAVRP